MNKLYTFLLLLLVQAASAQVLTRRASANQPVAFTPRVKTLPASIVLRLSAPEIAALLREDEQEASQGAGQPPRFGKDLPLALDLATAGTWTATPDGRVWSFAVASPGAFSLNFLFDKLRLPAKAELYLYNNDRTVVIGPITAAQNTPAGLYATDLLKGDKVTFELFEPTAVAGQSQLHLARVVHGYRNLLGGPAPAGSQAPKTAGAGATTLSFGQAVRCHQDVNCPAGNNWQTESNSVVLIIAGNGSRAGTGTLLNDGCQSLTPNVLTAFHMLDTNRDHSLSEDEKKKVQTWAFRFQYKSPSCGGGDSPNSLTISGSELLAAHDASDFALLLLSQRPQAGSGITYAGWDRSGAVPTSGASLHHPAGDVMKISVASDGNIQPADGSFWHANFTSGTVEEGSSGASLFDQNHRLVGQLRGDLHASGIIDYCGLHRGDYGRFDVSWRGGGTPDTRLQDWLTSDPNLMRVNTLATIPTTSGPDQACSRLPTRKTYLPCGASVAICDDQCVTYGTTPATIKGRILADNGDSKWNDYYALVGSDEFASGNEHEWAQWQLSYDNNNWYDIGNAGQASYSPGVIYGTTYFRRVSSHINHHWYGDSREYWYTSNVVTITSRPPTPTPANATYGTCGPGQVAVAANPTPSATSYNWWVPYAGWGVSTNGSNIFSTYNNGSSFVTTSTAVYISVPAGVAPGTYPIYFSANGNCGPKTADGTLSIVVTNGTNPTLPTAYWYSVSNDYCRPAYNLIMEATAGVTNYRAVLSDGNSADGFDTGNGTIIFSLNEPGPRYNISGTISASSTCGPITASIPGSNLAGRPSDCGFEPEVMSVQSGPEFYPNPASSEVTVQSNSQASQLQFYDAQGALRKQVELPAGATNHHVNLTDLPAGLYHIRVNQGGRAIRTKQLVVKP
jgi:hypothetical protein